MARFSDDEIRRYARQMVLPEVGGLGQERLRAARAEATSELEALYLAGAGIGKIEVPNEEIAAVARALNPLISISVVAAPIAKVTGEEAALRALATIKEALAL